MVPGVYIGKSNAGSYDLVSTGDFLSPITSTFKLKDSKQSLVKDIPLYLIINNVEIEIIKVLVVGKVTALRQFVSLNNITWGSEFEVNETINAVGTTIIKPFYTRIIVDDFIEYFNISQESSFKQYKLKLMYS